MLSRTFEVTDDTLQDLREGGIDGDVLAALGRMKARTFGSGRELLAGLSDTSPAPVSRKQARMILKFSRRSLLRLERVIRLRWLREWAEALIYAVVLAFLVRTFVFAPFKIPSGSMVPTIEIGDHIFATMYSYGIPVPLTGAKLFSSPVPRRDIVIFPFPEDPSIDYIKRVIAVGGDTVEVRGKNVYINGTLQDEPFAYYDPLMLRQMEANGSGEQRFGPVKVPPGSLFMMGDNRLNSSDSRVWGFVDARTVKGKGQIVYLSHDPNQGALSGWHLERIGTRLK